MQFAAVEQENYQVKSRALEIAEAELRKIGFGDFRDLNPKCRFESIKKDFNSRILDRDVHHKINQLFDQAFMQALSEDLAKRNSPILA